MFDTYGITPEEVAQRLGDYKVKDNEINVKICPFCNPERKGNYWKFYLNSQEGTYYCHRQNKCGVSGSFRQLLEHLGEEVTRPKVKIRSQTRPFSDKIAEYFKKRGISPEIARLHNVREKSGSIAFNYYMNGELVGVKYRNLLKGDDKEYWKEKGSQSVLWEIDRINTKEPLIITEGEIDKLALHQAGFSNVVSVPSGSNDFGWVDNCWETLDKLDEIIIWPDQDDAGQEFKDKAIEKLGEWKCRIVKSRWPDANYHLYKDGTDSVRKAIEQAEGIPVKRLLQLHEIESIDPTKLPRTKSIIPKLNKFLGGYLMGCVTVWTGINGSGKSTFLCFETANFVEQGVPTIMVTGELPNWLSRYWLELVIAGPANIKSKLDPIKDEYITYVPKDIKEKIRKWTEDKLYIYDSFDSLKAKDIDNTFRIAARRYGCKQFIIDNLMVLDHQCGTNEKYSKQAEFVDRMKVFAKKYDVHVHIVAHPRKPKESIITKDDIAGLAEIQNLADNILAVRRLNDKKREILQIKNDDLSSCIDIFKNRIYGKQDLRVGLDFHEGSKRLTQYGVREKITFGWEKIGEQKELA